MLLMLRTYAARPGCGLGRFLSPALCGDGNPIDSSPRSCWQVPLSLDLDDTTNTTGVRVSRSVDWGGEGGQRRSPV
jgi:hypothetical protein